MQNKKFVMSYSCGKDSTLALHKMISQNYEPAALIVMFNKDCGRSFFHGADPDMLEKYSEILGIPLITVPSAGEEYHLLMEKALREAKEMGAELACFGDIDIEANRHWCETRCENAGLEPVFPLWHRNREENVRELITLGYKCLIKSINNTLLPKSLLGKIIDEDVIREMERCKIDVCGENGEYHTLVVDGPIFKKPFPYTAGEVIDFGDYSVIDIK